jgi:hypothetical protein
VRDEAAQVVGDQPVTLAHAEAGGLAVDHPHPEHGMVRAVERGRGCELLVDVAFGAVVAAGLEDDALPGREDLDVLPLAREQRLAHERGHVAGRVKVGGQEVGVPGEELPQNRQDSLVRPQHLVDRLDPQGRSHAGAHPVEAVAGELLLDHPLPRIELEDPLDVALVRVDEAEQRVPADLLDGERIGLVPGLLRCVLEVDGVHHVLPAALGCRVREVDAASRRKLPPPGVEQAVVDLVPLVLLREPILEPVPLHHRGLDERGRGVGVELEQLGRRAPVVAEVEAADHARRLGMPRLDDPLDRVLGDAHLPP